jgi:hypothetical protein
MFSVISADHAAQRDWNLRKALPKKMSHLFVTTSNRMKELFSRCPIEEVMQVISGRWPTLLI